MLNEFLEVITSFGFKYTNIEYRYVDEYYDWRIVISKTIYGDLQYNLSKFILNTFPDPIESYTELIDDKGIQVIKDIFTPIIRDKKLNDLL